MGVLNVNNFGGTLFGVNKRDLPDGYAQVATNMHAKVGSFAPLNDDSAPVDLVDSSLTLLPAGTTVRSMFRYPFRSTGTTHMLAAGLELSVVKGQIIDDTYERCYMSDDTPGTNAPPYVLYGGGTPTIRPLGVPAPKTELEYIQNGVAQLTAEHLANVQAANELVILQQLDLMVNRTWSGRAASVSTPGYLDCNAADDASATGYGMKGDKPYQARIFGFDGAGLTFSNKDAQYFTWAMGTEFSTHTFTASQKTAVDAWSLSPAQPVTLAGNFAAVKYRAFYPTFALGAGATENAARAAILAIKQPGKTTDDFILTAPQLSALEARITALASPANPGIAAAIARINFRYELLTQLMDGKIGSTALGKMNYFLANDAGVQARIANAYDAFASAVWEKMNKAYLTAANANATYTGTSYPQNLSTLVFTATKGSRTTDSMSYIINVAKAMLTGDGTPSTSSDSGAAVSPYVSVRPISRLKTFLDAEKLTIYSAVGVPVERKDAVFQASLLLDFTAELYDLYSATTIEAMHDLAALPDIFVSGGETTAAAVTAARDMLELELSNLDAYYAMIPSQIKLLVKSYLKEIGSNDLHAEVDPSGKQVFTTRYYTWTYVNNWGEESQDWAHAQGEKPAALEVDQNDTVTLTLTGTPSPTAGITHWRIYRSNSASNTRYQLVNKDDIPIATTTFTDDLKSEQLQETLATDIWSAPPSEVRGGVTTYLQGFVNMPNNFLAAFINNTVYFSEVSAYYAWPPDYTITMAFDIVGMEVFGQTLVVMTKGGVYYVTGADPSAMSKSDPESNQACLSKQSIAKVTGGVIFASPNGLCLASSAGVQVFMPAPLGKTYWATFRPELMRCAEFDGVLYVAGGPLVTAAPAGNWQVVAGIHLATMKVTSVNSFGVGTAPGVTAWFVDRTTDSLWAALPHNGASPKAVNVMSASTVRAATWRSKRITLPQEDGFAWLQVMGEQTAVAGYGAAVKLYGYLTNPITALEVETVLANQTITNVNPVRVASGRFLEFEVEVTSKAQINHIIFAGTIEDLQQAT